MSLFLGLKESVSIPTGLLWFASTFVSLFLGDSHKEEIIAINSDSGKLLFFLEILTESFVIFGAITVIISISFYYFSDSMFSLHYNGKDSNCNFMREFKATKDDEDKISLLKDEKKTKWYKIIIEMFTGNEFELKSYEYPLIQNIAIKTLSKFFLIVGSLFLLYLSILTEITFLQFFSLFLLFFQIRDGIRYYFSVERKSVPNLRLYYALGTDSDCKSGKKEFKDSVASKNWGFLKANVEEIYSEVKRNYLSYYNSIVVTINNQNEKIDEKGTYKEAIWQEIGLFSKRLDNTYTQEYKYINDHGFGYLDKEINFEVWKATRIALFKIYDYQDKINELSKIKGRIFKHSGSKKLSFSSFKEFINNPQKVGLKEEEKAEILSKIKEVILSRKAMLDSISKIKDLLPKDSHINTIDEKYYKLE